MRGSGLNIIGPWDKKEFDCTAKFRYRQGEQKVHARIEGSEIFIEYETPQRAVTPGQYAVLYYENRCLGGAVIDEIFK